MEGSITRLGALLVLASALIPTRTVAQLPMASLPSALTASQDAATVWSGRFLQSPVASITSQDSSRPRLATLPPIQADSGRRHKSPVLAWFLSWLVPGGGQGYNGQWGKAGLFFVPAVVGVALAASNDGFSCSGDCGTRDVGLALLVVSSVASQIEAPIAASKINREARKTASSQVTLTIATLSF
jgi:hypothetical protein